MWQPERKLPKNQAGTTSPKAPRARATQAERRARTRALVLESASANFGEHGYEGTSLDTIARDAGVTIRPIYHYFGNKRALFEVVVEEREAILVRLLSADAPELASDGLHARLSACFELLADRRFRQVVLIDAPAVLGTDRWASGPVVGAAKALLGSLRLDDDPDRAEMLERMAIGALTAAALSLAESESLAVRRRRIDAIVALTASVFPKVR